MKYELILPDGRRFALAKAWTKIGRAEDNDLVITNSTVSRYHINVYLKPDSIIAENAGSQTGFYINGEPISQAKALKHGDVVVIGNAYLTFVRAGETAFKNPQQNKKEESTKNTSLYKMASKAAAKGISNSGENNRRLVIYGVLAAIVGLMVLSEDPETTKDTKKTTSSEVPLAFGLKPLPADSFIKSKSLKSESQMRAEGKFHEGLQDYYNQNFGRSRLAFQEAIEYFPQHSSAIEYLAKTEAKMLDSINQAIKDAEQSFGLGQLRRAKWQASQALSMISQQIPGYSRKLAQEADIEAIKRTLSQGQEETFLTIPCEQSQHKEKCNTALKILKDTRRALGDEDLIKRYEQ